ncbi:MAG: ATP-dependent DNA helicase RecQ [Paludibacteraceae bacterium]|nr:ATP-dependent DNA helicase RecQ [Paludibacteraceae bacterium]
METKRLIEIIENKCNSYQAIVLKGVDIKNVLELSEHYCLIEKDFIHDSKLDLDRMEPSELTMLFMNTKETCILTYETFILLTTALTNITMFKSVVVVNNNLIGRYFNCTNVDIPDFDSADFQEIGENQSYGNIFAFCEHENGNQYVQYIIPQFPKPLDQIDLFEPLELNVGTCEASELLSTDNGSIERVCEELNYKGRLSRTQFLVEEKDINNPQIEILNAAARYYGITLGFSVYDESNTVTVRSELLDLLKSTWGYDSFRDLDIYKNLRVNHDVRKVSQGEIIETVIEQAEESLNDDGQFKHVLLTSPTGAGKSLLFQLAAIYLAEHYGCVTIVVSPLVALMDDQVKSLKHRYKGVAAINGGKSAQEKEQILEEVRNGKISLLYLAPELLLSYTIQTFIGNRRLGLLVIDEAHTVTTWGRDFRVDYWFLGDHIRSMRNLLEYQFPIFALTATAVWDLNGNNDMVFDTIGSLYMDPCIQYIGVVKRENISFDIQNANFSKTYYDRQRKELTIKRIKESVDHNIKTIVYFPFRKNMNYIISEDSLAEYKEKVTSFESGLKPEEKKNNAEYFKTGLKPIMCATKAFGMGVDVPDIQMVYHHAPSGTLADYVQEIGRAARDKNIQGIAKLDFDSRDFKFMNILHGLSAIQIWQVRAVMKKLMSLFRMGNEKRNMLISSDDFAYIFSKTSENDIDQKVKSCLMLISHDLQNKYGFPGVIVRPKSMFSKCFVQVPNTQEENFVNDYGKFLKPIKEQKGIYILNADELWNSRFRDVSFAKFKYNLSNGSIIPDYTIKMRCRIQKTDLKQFNLIRKELNTFFKESEEAIHYMVTNHCRYPKYELQDKFQKSYGKEKGELFIRAFELVYTSEKGIGHQKDSICKLHNAEDAQKVAYQYNRGSYQMISAEYINCLLNKYTALGREYYCDKNSKEVKLCELLETLNLIEFNLQGGDSPMIFIRINNPYQLNQLVRSNSYENEILNGVQHKFEYAKQVFMRFFTEPMTDSERWNFIEDYFLGSLDI